RLIGALTAQTNYGVLYQGDMRLRPSGRAGPLATQIGGLAGHPEGGASPWEHIALTRRRVGSALSPGFSCAGGARSRVGACVEAVIRDVLCRARGAALIAEDAADMRAAIAREKGEDERWNLKYVAGGLIDIEFIAQYLQLVHAAETPDILDTSTAHVLDKAW